MKKTLALLLALVMVLSVSAAAFAEPSGKVMLYSSMQEAQLQAIEQAFEAKYPTVDMEYYYAGGGKLVTKMTTEAQDGGQIASDLVWLGDPSDYEAFKANGWLEPYVSPETDHTLYLVRGDEIKKVTIDVAFPVLHGLWGEDGTVQGIFETANLPYVGCGPLSGAITMDKFFTKVIADSIHIPQAAYVPVRSWELEDMDAVVERASPMLPTRLVSVLTMYLPT